MAVYIDISIAPSTSAVYDCAVSHSASSLATTASAKVFALQPAHRATFRDCISPSRDWEPLSASISSPLAHD